MVDPGQDGVARLGWGDIAAGTVPLGRTVELQGWLTGRDLGGRSLLLMEPPCCPGCRPSAKAASVLVTGCVPLPTGAVSLRGVLGEAGGALSLADARPVRGGIGRRRLLASAPLVCLAAAAPAALPQDVTAGSVTVDVHSHAGKLLAIRTNAAFTPVAAPMREGGLAVVCLAIVSDAPTHRVMPADHRIHPFREPLAGELYAYSQAAFARLHALAAQQSMPIVTDAAGLQRARADQPCVVVAAEGADFLEGNPDRVDEAYARWQLRHLQLTHYRVNELGDIQTEEPVHGGLTDAGAEVIRRCNKLGVVVDVAHGTLDLVRRAAAVTTKPLVLSHTSLTRRPRPFTRLITPEHAALVAGTGGMIGIWPVASIFPDMAALAAGMARMAAVTGIDHVGLGTDTMGLVGPATFESYAELGGLAAALLAAGFGPDDVRKLMGGNYARVFAASMA